MKNEQLTGTIGKIEQLDTMINNNSYTEKIFLTTLTLLFLTGFSAAAVTDAGTPDDVEVGQSSVSQSISSLAFENNSQGTIDVSSLTSISGIDDSSISVSVSGTNTTDSDVTYSSGTITISSTSDTNVTEVTSVTIGGIDTSEVMSVDSGLTYSVNQSGSQTSDSFSLVDTSVPDISVFNRSKSASGYYPFEVISGEVINGSVTESGTKVQNVSLVIRDKNEDTFDGSAFTSQFTSVDASSKDSGFDSSSEVWEYNMSRIDEDGNYTVNVSAFDSAGNEGYEETYFRIDRTPPGVENADLSISDQDNVNQILNTGENLSVTLNLSDRSSIEVMAVDLSEFGLNSAFFDIADGDLARDFSIPEGHEISGFNPHVVAVDEFGNLRNLTFSEGVDIDTVDPKASYENMNVFLETDLNSNGFANPGDTVKVSWNSSEALNKSNISSVKVDFSQMGGSEVTASDSNSDGVYTASTEITEGSTSSPVRAVVSVEEESGNVNSNTTDNILVDNTVPEVVRPDSEPLSEGRNRITWGNSVQRQVWSYGTVEDYVLKVEGYGDRVDVGTERGIHFYGSDMERRDRVVLPGETVRDLYSMEDSVLAVHKWGDAGSVSLVEKVGDDWSKSWTTELTSSKAHRVSADTEEGYVYVGAGGAFYYESDGKPGIFRLNLSTGEPDRSWNFTGFKGQVRGIEYHNVSGDVFFGTSAGEVYRVDPVTQEQVWKKSLVGQVGSLNVDSGKVFVGHGGNANANNPKPSKLSALDSSDGTISSSAQGDWVYNNVTEMVRTIKVTDNHVYAGTGAWNSTQSVRKIEKSSLNVEWVHDLLVGGNAAGIHRYNNKIFTGETWYAVDAFRSIDDDTGEGIRNISVYASTGTERGNPDLQDINDVAVDDNGNIYTATDNDLVRKIDSHGNEVWTFNYGDRVNALEVTSSGVYLGGDDFGNSGGVVKLGLGGEIKWNYSVGESVNDIAVNNEGIHIATDTYNAPGLIQIDDNGNENWVYDTGDGWVNSIGLDSSGVYVGGDQFASQTLTASSGSDEATLIKIDYSGNQIWSQSYGSEVEGVTVASDGRIHTIARSPEDGVLGAFNSTGYLERNKTIGVGPKVITASQNAIFIGTDSYDGPGLMKYSLSGESIWNKTFTNDVNAIATDGESNLFTGTGFQGILRKIAQNTFSVDYRFSEGEWKNLSEVMGRQAFTHETSEDGLYDYRLRIDDNAGNQGSFSSTFSSIADSKRPMVESALVIDKDTDGSVDRVNVTFSEPIRDETLKTDEWGIGKIQPDRAVTGQAKDDTRIRFEFDQGSEVPGTGTRQLKTVSDPSLEDYAGNVIRQVEAESVKEKDLADPVIEFDKGLTPISFPSKVGIYSLDEVLQNSRNINTSSIGAVWSYTGGTWNSYAPGRSSDRNDFTHVQGGLGYIIESSRPGKIVADIDQGRNESRTPSSLTLDSLRWNLVGQYDETPKNVSSIPALSNSGSDQVVALDPFRKIEEIMPGNAYWVQTSSSEFYTPEAELSR